MFLVGDPSRMQSPFLDQGMCQGARDVANLGWTLAAVLQGRVQGDAAERLLDSYGSSADPAGLATLLAERLGKLWGQSVVIDNKPGGQNTIGALAAPAHRARGNSQSQKRSSFSPSRP